MALCLAPTVKFESPDQATQFLDLIRDIYNTTYTNEPECRAYCWFRKKGDPCTVQGFEFYENERALTVTHRSSTPYKKMRQFLSTLQGPLSSPQLLFLTPIEGWLNHTDEAIRLERGDCKVVISNFKPGGTDEPLAALKKLSRTLNSENNKLACFVAGVDAEKEMSTSTTAQYLFVECYYSEGAYRERNPQLLADIANTSAAIITTTDCIDGFGFIRLEHR